MANPNKPLRGLPASPARAKTLPAVPVRVYDHWAVAEMFIAGPNIGPRITSGHVRFVRYRETPDGPELDPTEEQATATVSNLYAMAADPAWPEAKALLDAAEAFAQRLGQEQGIL